MPFRRSDIVIAAAIAAAAYRHRRSQTLTHHER